MCTSYHHNLNLNPPPTLIFHLYLPWKHSLKGNVLQNILIFIRYKLLYNYHVTLHFTKDLITVICCVILALFWIYQGQKKLLLPGCSAGWIVGTGSIVNMWYCTAGGWPIKAYCMQSKLENPGASDFRSWGRQKSGLRFLSQCLCSRGIELRRIYYIAYVSLLYKCFTSLKNDKVYCHSYRE